MSRSYSPVHSMLALTPQKPFFVFDDFPSRTPENSPKNFYFENVVTPLPNHGVHFSLPTPFTTCSRHSSPVVLPPPPTRVLPPKCRRRLFFTPPVIVEKEEAAKQPELDFYVGSPCVDQYGALMPKALSINS